MKYKIIQTSIFKKDLKKIRKRKKDLDKLDYVVENLASGKELPDKYKDHALINDKYYQNCRECHIEPDWLLIYKINNDELILLLVQTGTHSDLF